MHGRSTSTSHLLYDTLTTLVPLLGASTSARISGESPLSRTGALLGLRLLKASSISFFRKILSPCGDAEHWDPSTILLHLLVLLS